MTLSMSQALDEELPRYCGECGVELPQRGAQCAGCGALPEVTRAELEEVLSEPGRLARIEADRLRGEGDALIQEGKARHLQAARVLAAAAAETERDAAQDALSVALGDLEQANTVLEDAGRAEAGAAAQLAEADGNHRQAIQAEEAARRLRKGPAAETDALARLNAATDVLARYRAPAEAAANVRQAAAGRVAAAEGNVAACQDAYDRAALTVEQLLDPRLRFALAPVDDGYAAVVGQLAARAEKALTGPRPTEEERPVQVGSTMLPPNAQTFNGGAFSPGEPFPR
jgi:hypothetical protein